MKEITINANTHLAASGSRLCQCRGDAVARAVSRHSDESALQGHRSQGGDDTVETQPGTVIPEHVHGGVEWAFVLDGTMEDDEGVVSAGNFVYRPAGSRHSVRTPRGAKYIGLFHGSARSVESGRLFPDYDE
jgi:mannose-6-phosphate isomerase-like protein (cupin superfamily)